jgi:ABC-type sugar transport system ATPase subunit
MLRLEGLIKRFGTTVAVRNVNLDIAPGQMACVSGERAVR